MNTYRVVIGSSSQICTDVFVLRAKDCAEAEKKVLKRAGDDYNETVHAVKIEQIDVTFIE